MTEERIDPGNFAKLYGTITTSSVWAEPDHVLRVWVYFLARADAKGNVAGAVPGLAMACGKTVEQTEDALARLMAPDRHSRSKNDEGRRIREIEGGWHVINHRKYRDLRTEKQIADAERQREWRATRDMSHESVTERDMSQLSHEVSASASVSVVSKETELLEIASEKEPDVVASFARQFGSFDDLVEGFVRAQRSPMAVMATLNLHLTGEMSHEKGTPEQIGVAVQHYAAQEPPGTFKAAFFAGFVRRAKTGMERTENRRRDAGERRQIAEEERREAEFRDEEGEVAQLIADFKAAHPNVFEQFSAHAERSVPTTMTLGREIMVKQVLVKLIRDAKPDDA